ncbi:hypothetical protein L3Q82_014032, partial [Scortum barcoo]
MSVVKMASERAKFSRDPASASEPGFGFPPHETLAETLQGAWLRILQLLQRQINTTHFFVLICRESSHKSEWTSARFRGSSVRPSVSESTPEGCSDDSHAGWFTHDPGALLLATP